MIASSIIINLHTSNSNTANKPNPNTDQILGYVNYNKQTLGIT